MNVYHIEPPDRDGAMRIARAIYGDIRNSREWGRRFPEQPDADVLERLVEFSPREMRRVMRLADAQLGDLADRVLAE